MHRVEVGSGNAAAAEGGRRGVGAKRRRSGGGEEKELTSNIWMNKDISRKKNRGGGTRER